MLSFAKSKSLKTIGLVAFIAGGIFLTSVPAQAGKVCCDPTTGKSKGVSCQDATGCTQFPGATCQEICTTPESADDTANQITLPPFKAGSGILDYDPKTGLPINKVFSRPITSSLLAEYMIALNNFFFRLAIVLAVFMITLGGMQWLVAIGNASKIANAKETIQQAVIGLILALTATVLFNQIDQSFTKFGALSVKRVDPAQLNCAQYSGTGANKGQATCNNVKGCAWNATLQSCAELGTGGKCQQNSDCKAIRSETSFGVIYIPLIGQVPILKPGEKEVSGFCIGYPTYGTYPGQCAYGAPGEQCWGPGDCLSGKCDRVGGAGVVGHCAK